MKQYLKDKNFRAGLIITGLMLCVILVGLLWTPYDPNAMSGSEKLQGPSAAHLFGTDNFGRDIFSRVIQGAGATFLIAAAAVAIGLLIGLVLGGLTGYYGGVLDEVLMRFSDTILAFPSILLALVMIAILGKGKYNIIIALGILFLHIMPNIIPVLLSSVAIGFNNAVLSEASMSYLGVGVQPPDPSLGRLLSEAQGYLFQAPWYALFTGIAIILLILGFGLLSEGMGGE